jgi:hypothetical protein
VTARQFTPAPWEAREGSLHRRPWLVDAPGRRFIAQIDGPPDEEGEANARLIAAAPRMFAALDALAKRTLEYVGEEPFVDGLECDDEMRILAKEGLAVIATVGGEQ